MFHGTLAVTVCSTSMDYSSDAESCMIFLESACDGQTDRHAGRL